MCMGPSKEEKQAAADKRVAADAAARKAAEDAARQKREDIEDAIQEGSTGLGRKSLMKTSATGFLGRFG